MPAPGHAVRLVCVCLHRCACVTFLVPVSLLVPCSLSRFLLLTWTGTLSYSDRDQITWLNNKCETRWQDLSPTSAYYNISLVLCVTSESVIALHAGKFAISFLLVCHCVCVRVCLCPDLCMNFNLGALVFQECCHTRQKWNLWVCGFVSACCVSVLVCVCVHVCVSDYVPIRVSSHTHICTDGTLLHLWRLPLFLFSNSLSFSPFVVGMFTAVRLHMRTLL